MPNPVVESYFIDRDGKREEGPPPSFGNKDKYLDGTLNGVLLYFQDAYGRRWWEDRIKTAYFSIRMRGKPVIGVQASLEAGILVLRIDDGVNVLGASR